MTLFQEDNPTTMEIIGRVLIASLTMLIGKLINDTTTIALNDYIPQTNKNKVLFNICLIIMWLIIVMIISFIF